MVWALERLWDRKKRNDSAVCTWKNTVITPDVDPGLCKRLFYDGNNSLDPETCRKKIRSPSNSILMFIGQEENFRKNPSGTDLPDGCIYVSAHVFWSRV